MGPKLAKMVDRRADDGEAFGPHELREEGGNTSDAVAGDAVGGASGLELLVDGEGEEGPAGALNVVEEVGGDAVVGHLEDAPSFACMAYELEGIRVVEIDNRDRLRGEYRTAGGRVVVRLAPCIGVRQLLEGAEVRVFVVEMDRVGLKGVAQYC